MMANAPRLSGTQGNAVTAAHRKKINLMVPDCFDVAIVMPVYQKHTLSVYGGCLLLWSLWELAVKKKDITEKDLRGYGFTDKEIHRLDDILSRSARMNGSYKKLIDELGKRFIRSVFCFSLVFFALAFQILKYGTDGIWFFMIVSFFSIVLICFMTPLNLAWKIFLFSIKNR